MVAQLHPTPASGRILNGSFAMISDQLSMNTTLSPATRLAYVILVSRAGRSGWCEDSLEELGLAYGATARQMQRLINKLVKAKVVLDRPNRAKRGRAMLYAPLVGLTDERLRAVLAHESHPRPRAANTTHLSYLHAHDDGLNTTYPATDVSCLAAVNTTHLSPLPDSPIDIPVDSTDGIPVMFRGEEGEAGASVAAAAAVETIADDDQPTTTTSPHAPPPAPPPGPRSSPPKSSAAPKTVARSVHRKPRSEPPEAIPVSPALRDWATEQGYTPEIIASETERCLDWHRVEGKPSADWGASLRTWLKHELAYSREDGRALGDHGGRPSRQHADGGGRDYYATRRGRLNEPVVGWPGAPNSQSALDASGDDAWELK